MGKNRFVRIKEAKRKLKSRFKGKVPDGIIPEIGITEARRDELAKRDFSGPKKRTIHERHPDTLTTKELEETRFSGVRYNHYNNRCEVWVDGRVHASAAADKVARDPTILAEMHERVFMTSGSLVDISPKEGEK